MYKIDFFCIGEVGNSDGCGGILGWYWVLVVVVVVVGLWLLELSNFVGEVVRCSFSGVKCGVNEVLLKLDVDISEDVNSDGFVVIGNFCCRWVRIFVERLVGGVVLVV